MAITMRNKIGWILSCPEPMSCNTGQHTSSPCQPAGKKCSETSFQMHLIISQWWMNTWVMHPISLVSLYPSIPFQGKWDHSKVTSLCRHLAGCSVQSDLPGLQDLPFLCTDCFWHPDKSRGRWQSTCAWNSLSFITNHQGLSQGQALWLLHSHTFILGW